MREYFASVDLFTPEGGGLKRPLATPTPSLLLAFEDQEAMAEAMIATEDGTPLAPGESYRVRMIFWNPASEREALPQRSFSLWHGRLIGKGVFD